MCPIQIIIIFTSDNLNWCWMETKVTKEEFKKLFANCGYTVIDVFESITFYYVIVEELDINIRDIDSLKIEGLEVDSIGTGFKNGKLDVVYREKK